MHRRSIGRAANRRLTGGRHGVVGQAPLGLRTIPLAPIVRTTDVRHVDARLHVLSLCVVFSSDGVIVEGGRVAHRDEESLGAQQPCSDLSPWLRCAAHG